MKLLTLVFLATAFAHPSWACDYNETPYSLGSCDDSSSSFSSAGSAVNNPTIPTNQNNVRDDDVEYIQPVIDNEDPK